MGRVEKRRERRRQSDSIWQVSIAAIISLFFVSSVPFPHLRAFPRTYAAGIDSAVSTANTEGRLAVFDDVWQTVNDRYYDENFHGVNWWAQRAQFRSQAADARDPDELYAVLRRLVNSLRDAHTRVYAPEQKFDWEHPRFVTVGLSLREIEGQITVAAVERGSEAAQKGIRAGDLLKTINGGDALAALERKLGEQSGSSTPQAARLLALSSLAAGPPETAVSIQWLGHDNRLRQANLQRHWQQRTLGVHVTRHNGVAVIAIDAFTRTLAAEFARQTTGKIARVHGIVIDLRNNGGGDAQAMAEIATAFLPLATRLGQFTDRHGNVALKIETGVTPLLDHPRNPSVQVPIVVLANERTSSAAEIFLAALKQTAHATILGGQTCGCVLAVRTRHALPDGGELEVSELDYHTALGVRLEGAGITPDEVISATRRDIYAGRDRPLQSAFTRIKSHPHP
ncbi:MAG: hypothetical protein JWM21_732 [Acidobacteria bacterium]|nr:hypothetical protein [Acidobacteriota bacterium]